jgi:hypothetical protein
MKKAKWLVTAVLAAVVLAILLAACGKKTEEKALEKAIESETGKKADVDLSGDGVKIETEEGTMRMSAGEGAKIPQDFPKDVYIMKGAKVEMAMETEEGYSVALTIDQPRDKVAQDYKKKMSGEGWTQKAYMDMGEQIMIAYEKGDRAANVLVIHDEKVTRLNLTVVSQ